MEWGLVRCEGMNGQRRRAEGSLVRRLALSFDRSASQWLRVGAVSVYFVLVNKREPSSSRAQVFEAWQVSMRQFLANQQAAVQLLFGAQPPGTPVDLAGSPGVGVSLETAHLDRFVPQEFPRPAVPSHSHRGPGLLILHAPDGLDSLRNALAVDGRTVAQIPESAWSTEEAFAEWLGQVRKAMGPVHEILHLSPAAPGALPGMAGWRQTNDQEIRRLLRLLQGCAADLVACHGRVLAFSRMGGAYGRTAGGWSGSPAGGAAAGLLKTFQLENPTVLTRTIDLDSEAADRLLESIDHELSTEDPAWEIGWLQGERVAFEQAPAPLSPVASGLQAPHSDWVVLATGGARGITAAVLKSVLQSGMTLVLAGRSPLPDLESAETRERHDASELKRYFFAEAKERGEKVTPAQIDQAVNGLMKQREIESNLAEFEAMGVRVEYIQADAAHPQAAQALIEGIYRRHNRLDAVVHGAGLIEDKRVIDKQLDSFDRVFQTKVDSAFLLIRHLRLESLRWLALFGSVAGRTGNRGQCDYAAANEVINRLGWWLQHRRPNLRVSVINWGPWASGMASAAVQDQFRQRGVIPIPPNIGSAHFAREMKYGGRDQIESVAGTFLPMPTVPTAREQLPLVRIGQLSGKDLPVFDVTLDTASFGFLNHHRIGGAAVLPAMFALELAAEAVQATFPDQVVDEVRDHRVLQGVRCPEEGPLPLSIHLEETQRNEPGRWITASLFAFGDPKRVHYRTQIRLAPAAEAPQLASPLPAINPTPFAADESWRDWLFHGPALQLLLKLETLGPFSIQGLLRDAAPGELIPSSPADAQWLFAPTALDVTLQAVLCWSVQQTNAYSLPASVARVRRWGGPLAAEPGLRFHCDVEYQPPYSITCSASIIDRFGYLRLQMDQARNTRSETLMRLVASGH